jgi:hypothetical protein
MGNGQRVVCAITFRKDLPSPGLRTRHLPPGWQPTHDQVRQGGSLCGINAHVYHQRPIYLGRVDSLRQNVDPYGAVLMRGPEGVEVRVNPIRMTHM